MNGGIIRELRQERKWSQQELADRAGISQAQVANLETGVSDDPKRSTFKQIARAFDMTLDALDVLLDTDPTPSAAA